MARHSLTATATDAAGNTGVGLERAQLSPSIPTRAGCADDRLVLDRQRGAGDGITNDNTLTLTGTAEAEQHGQGL